MASFTMLSRTAFFSRDSIVGTSFPHEKGNLRRRDPQLSFAAAAPGQKGGINHGNHITFPSQTWLGRPIAASCSSRIAAASVDGADCSKHREELKEKLLRAVESITGNLDEECLAIVAELQKVNPNVDVLVEKPDLPIGVWETVRATFKGTGRKGEGKSDVGFRGAPLTLGRMCFNMFKPTSLDVFMEDSFNKIDGIGPDAYHIIITFTFDNPRGSHLPPVEGMLVNTAGLSNVDSMKQEVAFHSSVLRPRNPERDLEVWKEIFGENSGMDESGQVFRPLANFKNTNEYLYVDDNLRITLGGLGAHVVGRRRKDLTTEMLASFSPMKSVSATKA